jgi:hypothetical protein
MLKNFPPMRITTSSAYVYTKQLQSTRQFSRPLAIKFQSKGDKTPLCRHPHRTLMSASMPLISLKMSRDFSMKSIHLSIVGLTRCIPY